MTRGHGISPYWELVDGNCAFSLVWSLPHTLAGETERLSLLGHQRRLLNIGLVSDKRIQLHITVNRHAIGTEWGVYYTMQLCTYRKPRNHYEQQQQNAPEQSHRPFDSECRYILFLLFICDFFVFLFSTIFFGCFACDNKYAFSLDNTHLFYSDHIFFSCFICQFAEYCIIISNDYDVDIRLDWVRSARTRGKCMYTMRRHAISTHCEHIAHKQSVQSSTSSVAIHTPNATRTRFYLHFAVLATCENLMVMGDGNAYGDHWRAIMRSSK